MTLSMTIMNRQNRRILEQKVIKSTKLFLKNSSSVLTCTKGREISFWACAVETFIRAIATRAIVETWIGNAWIFSGCKSLKVRIQSQLIGRLLSLRVGTPCKVGVN